MKRKILLVFIMAPFFSAVYGQKERKVTAYAITGVEKGQSNWTEVRLIDIKTGEELKSIYKNSTIVEALNARTGKPVIKKDIALSSPTTLIATTPGQRLEPSEGIWVIGEEIKKVSTVNANGTKRIINVKVKNLNADFNTNVKANVNTNVNANVNTNIKQVRPVIIERNVVIASKVVQTDKPFATNSAACAYDKKHERLYYTPMGINQLRYIDLQSNKIYYFEDEPFGAIKNLHDVPNQITRMVIASDGNGYALTNDGNHLIRFTTGKKPEITDLGALTEDAVNATSSIHNYVAYGGDMIADNKKNLFLITANRQVFKISIDNKLASYQGSIKGLPKGFTTNGAVVEEGANVIVSSSASTDGYYRFDLATLQAEKVSAGTNVFNASDLANANLVVEKKKKEKKIKDIAPDDAVVVDENVNNPESKAVPKTVISEIASTGTVSVYPNPVLNSNMRLSFANQPAGKYQVQFMDAGGRIIKVQEVTISNKVQVEEFHLPELTAAGNYLVKVINAANGHTVVNKIVVQ